MDFHGIGWISWKRDEKTREFVDELKASVTEIQDAWLNNVYVAESQYKSDMLNAAALAQAQALQQIISTIENIKDEKDE